MNDLHDLFLLAQKKDIQEMSDVDLILFIKKLNSEPHIFKQFLSVSFVK